MPTESIIFAPELDERDLDRETQKVDERLQEVGTDIPTSFDMGDMEGGLEGLAPPGVGGGAGGGAGVGTATGIGALASKIPKPISGVAASSVLPIALAGGVGAGMLSAMHSSSGALQTTTSLFGTALDIFFRPFGNFLSDALRPFANSALDMAVNFNDMVEDDGLAVALMGLGGDVVSTLGGGIANAFEDSLPGGDDFGTGDMITLGVTGLTAAKLASMFGTVSLSSLVTGMSSGTLSGYLGSTGISSVLSGLSGGSLGTLLGSVGLGTVVTTVGSVGALIGGTAMLTDLVDGDISDWNLAGKFGQAMGRGFEEKWPDTADTIEKFFKNNIFADLGRYVGQLGDNAMDPVGGQETETKTDYGPGGPGTFPTDFDPTEEFDLPEGSTGGYWEASDMVTQSFRESLGPDSQLTMQDGVPHVIVNGSAFEVPDGSLKGNQRGSVVRKPTPLVAGEAGPEVIAPYAEFRRTIEGVAQQASDSGGGGEVDMSSVEQKLDELNRNLRSLKSMFDVTVEVDGEQIARASKDGERNRIADRNPTV